MLVMARPSASILVAERIVRTGFRSTARAWSRIMILPPLGILCIALLFLMPPRLVSGGQGQLRGSVEILVSEENAYNPIPSPDGRMIAYVRTGWERLGGSGGFGSSNLLSDVEVMDGNGVAITERPLADGFLAGWTPDGKKLACFRDWKYSLVTLAGKPSEGGEVPDPAHWTQRTERVTYLPSVGSIAWSTQDRPSHTSIETRQAKIAQHDGWLGEFLVPSPDGKYLAVFDGSIGSHIWIYNNEHENWSDLGVYTAHPDEYWDHIKPTWSPWFPDSSRLAFISESNLIVSTPDGGERISIPVGAYAGLPAPSPNGESIAYVTFDPRPEELRSDLQFWGGTIIWIVSATMDAKPRAVTQKNSSETYDLKWWGDGVLLFDRVEDLPFLKKARIWKVLVSR
jgi:WD40 repeat protein